jgi:hypothetical protein
MGKTAINEERNTEEQRQRLSFTSKGYDSGHYETAPDSQ